MKSVRKKCEEEETCEGRSVRRKSVREAV